MKKIILPLLLLTATTFAFEANAKGIASQIKRIHCDFRGSEAVYNITKKTVTRAGRTETTVNPMTDLQINDENDTIIVTTKLFTYVFKDEFRVAGRPYKLAPGDEKTYVLLKLTTDECTGEL